MNRLSVIIPSYNAARFLTEAVGSLEPQRLRPDEGVIVNDGSQDDTRRVVARMQKRFIRIPIVYEENPSNPGGGATRNRCVRLSRGEYIFCLDADNQLLTDTPHQFVDRAFRHLKNCYTEDALRISRG